MRRRELVILLLVTVPPVVLSVLGLFHPMVLNAETGHHWRQMHLILLPVFPLLALGPFLTVWRESTGVKVAVGLLGFVYAVYYTALDVLSGIAAGSLQVANARPQASIMFGTGNSLATYGVWAFLVATVLASIITAIRCGIRALPGAVLAVGAAVSFLDSHIYWPRGGITMLVLAAGWALLFAAQYAPRRSAPASQPASVL